MRKMNIEEIREKAKQEKNIFKFQFYVMVLYMHWFLFTWGGRFLTTTLIMGVLIMNIMLHEIRPAAQLDVKQTIQMKKLEQELVKNNSNLLKNEIRDNFNPSITTWRSKDYGKIYNAHLKILDQIRILKNEAFVKNGFESWQNRLMNALPRIWILNTRLKKLAYNEHAKYNIRKEEEEKKNEKLHKR